MNTPAAGVVPRREEPPLAGRGILLTPTGVVTLTGVSAALLALPVIALGVFGPEFEAILLDFGVALPVLTRWLLAAGAALHHPAVAALTLSTLVAFVAVVGLAARRRAWVLVALLAACAAWFVLSTAALLVSFYTPLVAMIESLQGGPPA